MPQRRRTKKAGKHPAGSLLRAAIASSIGFIVPQGRAAAQLRQALPFSKPRLLRARSMPTGQAKPNQHKAPPARVLQVPDAAQSTRPPERAGVSTKVSALSPDVDCAVAVMTPTAS